MHATAARKPLQQSAASPLGGAAAAVALLSATPARGAQLSPGSFCGEEAPASAMQATEGPPVRRKRRTELDGLTPFVWDASGAGVGPGMMRDFGAEVRDARAGRGARAARAARRRVQNAVCGLTSAARAFSPRAFGAKRAPGAARPR
jgi:hypothetical protein